MIIILVSPVSINPKLFACVTDADVLKKFSISGRSDGGACVCQDPIFIDDVSY